MKIEKLKDDIIASQNEYIMLLKQMVEQKQKYIDLLERSLDIQDNHIAKQDEMIDEMKQSIETLVRDYNRLQTYHILNKTK
jgi:hypothetical protein